MDTAEAAKLCQRSENVIRDTLSAMEQHGYIEHGGKGRGTYWNVNPAIYAKLSEKPVSEKRRRIDWEAAKTRILSILKERARRGEPGLSNAEIRQITMFDRHQVQDLMNELRKENPEISPPGKGRYAQYENIVYGGLMNNSKYEYSRFGFEELADGGFLISYIGNTENINHLFTLPAD
ncbi:MAG: hypothetical protein LBN34_02700 [Clostridiales Family XIII bacterium]|nr:hypothetical protein [Clostridiales Family XIII bacterium]